MKEPIISVSGLRGIVGEGLSPEIAMRYACAFAGGLPAGPLLISRDGRPTGRMLGEAVRSGLMAMGRDVIDAGVAATPTAGILIRRHCCAGGIQISASHNPPEYNGLKLLSSEGRIIDKDAGEAVLERYARGEPSWVSHHEVGNAETLNDTTSEHCRRLATVGVERIRQRHYRVVLDSNHGAGGLAGRPLLEQLGCQVTVLGESPDGQFSHPAEPLAENLAEVCRAVVGADVGFCQDPDADRLAVIDKNGRYLGEEYTLAMCVDHVLRHTPGPIVTNCSSSRMSQDLARRYTVPFAHSPVGEANVVQGMLARKAVFGGEGNGGPIDPRVGYIRDSLVGMALLLDAMSSRDMEVGELADELPKYYIYKTKVEFPGERLANAFDQIEGHFSEARPSRPDGLRLDWPTAWLLIRGSNTEPIVRVIAEAKTAKEARRLCDESISVLRATG